MAVMKQMQECLDRAFQDKPPTPSRKWKAFINYHPDYRGHLHLYHYHHLVLVYDTNTHAIRYQWWEKPADKRGLDSAKEYLEERWRKLQENQG